MNFESKNILPTFLNSNNQSSNVYLGGYERFTNSRYKTATNPDINFVERITGRRKFKEKSQVKVRWLGLNEEIWIDAKDIVKKNIEKATLSAILVEEKCG